MKCAAMRMPTDRSRSTGRATRCRFRLSVEGLITVKTFILLSLPVLLLGSTNGLASISTNCEHLSVPHQCRCWNSEITCVELGSADLRVLHSLPEDITYVNITLSELLSLNEESLGGFSNIRTLTMRYNGIVRVDPGTFSSTVLLEFLDLSHNELEEFDFGVVKLPHLRLLDLSYNSLLELKLNPSLRSLSSVLLEWNRLTYLENTFDFINTIERLKLSGNRIGNNLQFMRHLPHLVTLWLSENNVSSPNDGAFDKNGKLEFLRLDSNAVMHLDFLGNLKSLKGLNLTNNIIEYVPEHTFKAMVNLTYLYLDVNNISDSNFTRHINNGISTLFLSRNNLQKIHASDFQGKTVLRRLTLSHNNITNIEFLTELPSIEILSVDHNIINNISNYLLDNKHMLFLDISNNYIEHLHFIAHAKYLKYLVSFGNNISTIEPSIFENSKIEELDLSDNHLQHIEFLQHAQTIQKVYLTKNNISRIPKDIFKEMSRLEIIDISKNPINNTDFIFYSSSLRSVIASDCTISSIDESPLRCSRQISVRTPQKNRTLSLITTTTELWEECYGKIGILEHMSTTVWSLQNKVTFVILIFIIVLLIIVLAAILCRRKRKRNYSNLRIHNEQKIEQC